jgi:hypothetical protein
MREVFKIAGRASRQAKEAASLVALAVWARVAAATAAAAASYAGGGGARGSGARGGGAPGGDAAAAAARGAAEAMDLEVALKYEVTYVSGDEPLGVELAGAAAGVVVHSLSALPAG